MQYRSALAFLCHPEYVSVSYIRYFLFEISDLSAHIIGNEQSVFLKDSFNIA